MVNFYYGGVGRRAIIDSPTLFIVIVLDGLLVFLVIKATVDAVEVVTGTVIKNCPEKSSGELVALKFTLLSVPAASTVVEGTLVLLKDIANL